jgi:hypothetical protein
MQPQDQPRARAEIRRRQPQQPNTEAGTPWPSPQTDPTNPYHQETAGEMILAERASERRERGPGLTERERGTRNS